MKPTLLLFALLITASGLSAQWTNDTDVNTLAATLETGDLQSIGTSDGKTYIAYWHNVPAPQNYEMRLQLLDENGNLLFGPEGMLVNNVVPMSTFTTLWSMAVDHANNVYIGFNGSGAGNVAYVHKISPNGAQLWGNSGVVIGSGFDVKVLPMSNGEVIASWLPGTKGNLIKLDENGVAVWPAPVTIEPLVSNHKTSAGELAELSGGDFAIIIHDRGGSSPSALPYAQRYNGNGATVWPAPVALSSNYYTSFNRRYSLTQDGDNLYFGYSGAQGIQPLAFLQRINPDGSLPWGINGSRFSTQTTDFERDIKVAYEAGSDVLWAICEYSNSSQGEVGEYVQKFDKLTGARLLSDVAKQVYPISPAYISHRGNLQIVDGKPLFVISDGDSNGVFPKDLLAVYLDENGEFVWPDKTRPVATNATGVKSRIQFNKPVNKQATCVWAEMRGGAVSRPFAQNIDLACALPAAGYAFMVFQLQVELWDTSTGGDSVLWDFGDGNTSSMLNPFHVYSTLGDYTVCQYVTNACGTDTFCQVISVGCIAPVADFSYALNNLTATFTSTATNATDFSWDFGDGGVKSFDENTSHTYAAEGSYTVCHIVGNNCAYDTVCQVVTVISSSVKSPEETHPLTVAPNPNSGRFFLDLTLQEASEVDYQIFSADGSLIEQRSVQLPSGQQQIRVNDLGLDPGVYFVRVSVAGASEVAPIFVIR